MSLPQEEYKNAPEPVEPPESNSDRIVLFLVMAGCGFFWGTLVGIALCKFKLL